nr:autotransporter outer membrane beta-barrel domain-containing protein [Luteibacter rhizovicinus]
MAVYSYGRSALALALFGALVVPARGTHYPHSVVVNDGEAFSLDPGDRITIDGPGVGRAVEVRRRGSFDAYDVDIINHSSGNAARHAYGLLAFGEASAFVGDSRMVGSGTRSIGVHAQDISRITLQNVALTMSAADSIGISSRSGSRVTANGVRLRVDGENAIGVLAAGTDTRIVGSGLSIVHAGKRGGAGKAFEVAEAIAISGGANVALTHSSLLTEQPAVDTVSIRGATSILAVGDTRIIAQGVGASAIALAGGTVTVDGGEVRGAGHAIRAVHGDPGDVAVTVSGGAQIAGRIENADQLLTFTAENSHVHGDIVSTGSGPLRVRLANSSWIGRGERVAELTVADGSWKATGDSSVQHLALLGHGRIAFDEASPASSLHVGTFANPGNGGSVTLRARLDVGGAAGQLADRLLVSGDATGSTTLHIVNAGGAGADTSPLSREPHAGDGISVVQVGGQDGTDSFQLAGGYVAAGPWQYGLVAYAPGSSDARQRLVVGEGNDHWDYRLQSNRIDAFGNPVNDEASMRGAATRARLVPQGPAYLVLAHALFGYGRASMDAWRPDDPAATRDPAWRVRSFGGHAAYRSTLPFQRYATDYVRSDRGLQIAGDVLAWSSGAMTMRAGLGLTTGSTRIAPRDVDGVSRARANARGMVATYVLDTEDGWHATASYGYTHHRIDVNTPLRGEVLGRFRANANEASIGSGFRWHPVERLVLEPAASLLWQRLRFVSATDRDGLLVRPGSPSRVTLRTGARASMRFEPRGDVLAAWSPYIDTRYVITRGSGESVDVSGVRLATGSAGRATELAAGAAWQFRHDLTAYVDVTARARVGHGGESGMSARAGVIYPF